MPSKKPQLNMRMTKDQYDIVQRVFAKTEQPSTPEKIVYWALAYEKTCERESERVFSEEPSSLTSPLSLSPQDNELELAKKAGIPIEEWQPECQFGTWMKDEKMVYCDCPFPSIVKSRPKNHLIPKIVCERCLSRVLTLLKIEAEKERMQFERKGIKVNNPSPERTDLHTQWNETSQPVHLSTRKEVYCKKRDYVMDSKKCSEICGGIGWTIRRDQCIEAYKKNSLS